MKAKEPAGLRTANTQPNLDAIKQDRDRGLPSNRSLTPRAEEDCVPCRGAWDNSAPAGALTDHITGVGPRLQ